MKPHKRPTRSFIITLGSFVMESISFSFFASVAQREFRWAWLDLHWFSPSLSHRFTLPLSRRWFESPKGQCFLKSPLLFHTSHTHSDSTTFKVRMKGWAFSILYFIYIVSLLLPACVTNRFLMTPCKIYPTPIRHLLPEGHRMGCILEFKKLDRQLNETKNETKLRRAPCWFVAKMRR